LEYFNKKFKNELINTNIKNRNEIFNKEFVKSINIGTKTPEELKELSDRLAKEVIDEVTLEEMVDHIVRDLKDISRTCRSIKKKMKGRYLNTQVEV